LHRAHPPVASGTHAVPVVWTSMATHFYGHPIPRTVRRCTRCGRDAELLGGCPTLVCTHHTRLSLRGRTPYPWFGLLWQHTAMATQFRARTASARGPVGMRNCWGDAQHWFAATTPTCRVADARRTRGLDFYGHTLLWPPMSAHGPPVHAARKGCGTVGGTPDIVLHPPHPPVASGTQAVPVVWTSMAKYFSGQSKSAHGRPVHAAR